MRIIICVLLATCAVALPIISVQIGSPITPGCQPCGSIESGMDSLLAAIGGSQGTSGALEVNQGVYNVQAETQITQNVSVLILGLSNNVVFAPVSSVRVFSVSQGTLIIQRVQFVNCTSEVHSGACLGIYNMGAAEIKNCSFSGADVYRRTVSLYGAAISLGGQSSFFGENLLFQDCAAVGGGAINLDGSAAAVIKDCVFDSNFARNGGAMSVRDNSTISISSSVFINNFVSENGGAMNVETTSEVTIADTRFGQNGAEMGGGAISASSYGGNPATVMLSLLRCNFDENTALNQEVGGGALYIFQAGVTVVESTFERNNGTGMGGAFALVFGNLEIASSLISSNSADNGGALNLNGGGLSFFNTTFSNNSAVSGGALYIAGPYVISCVSVSIINNVVGRGFPQIITPIPLGAGGGIAISAVTEVGLPTQAVFTNCRIEYNIVYGSGSLSSASGGGVFITVDGRIPFVAQFFNSSISNNSVLSTVTTRVPSGGGIYVNIRDHAFPSNMTYNVSNYAVGVQDCVIADNIVYSSQQGAQGGGVYGANTKCIFASLQTNPQFPAIHISGTTVKSNYILAGSIPGQQSIGGGIVSLNGGVSIVDSIVDANSAIAIRSGQGAQGGGIAIFSSCGIEHRIVESKISGVTISGNTIVAGSGGSALGGGIFSSLHNVIFDRLRIVYNVALGQSVSGEEAQKAGGGGVYCAGQTAPTFMQSTTFAIIRNSIIAHNSAGKFCYSASGGGFSISGMDFTLANSLVTNNTSTFVSLFTLCSFPSAGGGFISLSNVAQTTLVNTIFSNNNADVFGGGVAILTSPNFFSPVHVQVSNCTFDSNRVALNRVVQITTTTLGAGIAIMSYESGRPFLRADIEGSTFSRNYAGQDVYVSGQGGAVAVKTVTLSMRGCKLTDNIAFGTNLTEGHGGGLYAYKSDVNVSDTEISNNMIVGEGSGPGVYVDGGGEMDLFGSACAVTDNSGGGLVASQQQIDHDAGTSVEFSGCSVSTTCALRSQCLFCQRNTSCEWIGSACVELGEAAEGDSSRDVLERSLMCCLNRCSHHGVCSMSLCECDFWWSGESCGQLSAGAVIVVTMCVVGVAVMAVLLGIYFHQKTFRSKERKKLEEQLLSDFTVVRVFDTTLREGEMIQYGDIEFGDKIGSGSAGTVYKATWKNCRVAVKRTHASLDENTMRQISQEVDVMSKLRHPNVLFFIGTCYQPPELYLIVEYCPGGDLRGFLDKHPDVSLYMRYKMSLDGASGLAFLHSRGFLHRDIKSPNMLITADGGIVIADLGLSVLLDHCTKTLVGTPAWIAPEVFAERSYSKASDVYAFGVVIWEVFTGQLPPEPHRFHGRTLPRVEGMDETAFMLSGECCNEERGRRPTMDAVWSVLKQQHDLVERTL